MNTKSRRSFLQIGSAGLTALWAEPWTLSAGAPATERSGSLEDYERALRGFSEMETPAKWEVLDGYPERSSFRRGAPFRGKITPPGAPGLTLLIGGRVWGLNTRAPLRNSVLEIWQADAEGRLDNDDPKKPPARDVFLYRGRLLSDETGWYEFETLKPGPLKLGGGLVRPSHINYRVQYPGYRSLVTQIYFRGDPHQENDPFVKPSVTIELKEHKAGNAMFQTGRFDIVLEPL